MIDIVHLKENFRAVREKSPLVHNITNYVAMNFSANALLAIGASPVMSHATEEVAEFNGLYEQYKANPDVIKNGVFRNRVSKVLTEAGATIIVPDGDNAAKVILP